MKLYATVTSERASKGQGGNEFIEAVFQVEYDNGEREKFCSLRLNRVGDEYMLHFVDGGGAISPNPIHRVSIKKKAEQQKGDNCGICGTNLKSSDYFCPNDKCQIDHRNR